MELFQTFVGLISPIDLLSNPDSAERFFDQAQLVDNFANLVFRLDIGLVIPFSAEGNKTFLIGIFDKYRDFMETRDGQEPADD